MGVRRRGLAGGLAGLGLGLQDLSQVLIKRRMLQDEQNADAEKAASTQKAQLLQTFMSQIAQDPSRAQVLNPFAEQLGVQLPQLSQDTLLAGLRGRVGAESDPTKLPPDAVSAVQSVGGDVTPTYGQTAQRPGSPDTLPSTQFGPVQPKGVQSIESLLKAKREQIAARERETGAHLKPVTDIDPTTLGQRTRFLTPPELPGQTFATNLTPDQQLGIDQKQGAQDTAQRVDLERQLTPIMVSREGQEETARVTAKVKAEAAQMGLSPEKANLAAQLATGFRQESTTFKTREEAFRSVLAAVKQPSAAGDLSLIFAYMRLLDPGSTVREGEFANAQNSAGVPTQIRNLYNRTMSGERLAPEQRTDFVNQAFQNYQAAKQGQQRVIADYLGRAQQTGVPPSMVVREMDPALDTAPTLTPGSTLNRLLPNAGSPGPSGMGRP